MPEFQISRFGVIPKSSQPGHLRLILDLSHPDFSINDSIDPQLCSLAYPTVHDAVQQVLKLGRRTLLAKIDIEQAFRNVPVHPSSGSSSTGYDVVRPTHYRHSTAVQLKIHSQNFQCNCTCSGVDLISMWDILLLTLLRQLSDHGSS